MVQMWTEGINAKCWSLFGTCYDMQMLPCYVTIGGNSATSRDCSSPMLLKMYTHLPSDHPKYNTDAGYDRSHMSWQTYIIRFHWSLIWFMMSKTVKMRPGTYLQNKIYWTGTNVDIATDICL